MFPHFQEERGKLLYKTKEAIETLKGELASEKEAFNNLQEQARGAAYCIYNTDIFD